MAVDLIESIESGDVDTVILAFTDHYGRLMGKRLDAAFFASDPAAGTHACDYLFTVDMEMEPLEGFEFSDWESGYGDVNLVPDLATARVLPWLERTALVMCDVVDHEQNEVDVAPRSILRRQVARARDRGFVIKAASELEYFLYRTSYRDAAEADYRYRDLEAAGWYIEDYNLLQAARTEDVNGAFRRHLAEAGVDVESTKGEFGRGQHELNIGYCEVLEMADRHVLLKQACKEIAEQHGTSVTFMAKPDGAQAGSSSHLHLSVWVDDRNAFVGNEQIAGLDVSQTFRSFLAGWMGASSELMMWMAPTVNSYKRYQARSWAPTAIAWSPDNRTAGFRVVGQGDGLRIECRLPGADVNPYLAYSAAIAGGLAGIDSGLDLIDPHLGDVYDSTGHPALPGSLAAAAERFAASDLAHEAFGTAVVDHYCRHAREETAAFDRAVTDWERRRYFERI